MTAAASAYWSARSESGYAPNWFSFCNKEICRRITGGASTAPFRWVLGQVFGAEPAPHVLEIGCLSGDKLAGMLRDRVALRVSGLDIAADAIARGKAKHGEAVSLREMDLNNPVLPAAGFSAVVSNGVLHHIENLEVCVQALYDALTPGGVLIASEYTGPRRYLYSAKELRFIEEGVAMLPLELQAPFHPNSLANKLLKDPSESVRSRDIGPILDATFDDLEVRPYGGNVLQRALSPTFFASFDGANDDHRRAVEAVVAFDAEIYARQPSHHAFFVARKAA